MLRVPGERSCYRKHVVPAARGNRSLAETSGNLEEHISRRQPVQHAFKTAILKTTSPACVPVSVLDLSSCRSPTCPSSQHCRNPRKPYPSGGGLCTLAGSCSCLPGLRVAVALGEPLPVPPTAARRYKHPPRYACGSAGGLGAPRPPFSDPRPRPSPHGGAPRSQSRRAAALTASIMCCAA